MLANQMLRTLLSSPCESVATPNTTIGTLASPLHSSTQQLTPRQLSTLSAIHQQNDDSFFELFKDSSGEWESNEVEDFLDSSLINNHKLQEGQKILKKAMENMFKIVSYFIEQIRLMCLKNKPQNVKHHSDPIHEEIINIDKKTKKFDELFEVIEEDSFAKEDNRKCNEKAKEESEDNFSTEEAEDQIFQFGAVLLLLFEKALLKTQRKCIYSAMELDNQKSVFKRKQLRSKNQDIITPTKCEITKSDENVEENESEVVTTQKRKFQNFAETPTSNVSLIGCNTPGDVVKEVEDVAMFSKNVSTRFSKFFKKAKVSKMADPVSEKTIQTNTKAGTSSTDGVTLCNKGPLPGRLAKSAAKAGKTVRKHSTSFYSSNGFKFRSRSCFDNYLAKTKSNLKQFLQVQKKSMEENKELKEEIQKLKSLLESQKEDLSNCESENCSSTGNISITNGERTIESELELDSPTSMTAKSPMKKDVTKNKENLNQGDNCAKANTSEKLKTSQRIAQKRKLESPIKKDVTKSKENLNQGDNCAKANTSEKLKTSQRTAQKRKLEVRENDSEEESLASNVSLIDNDYSDNVLKGAEDSNSSRIAATQPAKSPKKRRVSTKTKEVSKTAAKVKSVASSIDIAANAKKVPPGWLRKIKIRRSGATKKYIGIYFCSPEGVRLHSRTELAAYLVKNKSNLKIEDFNFSNEQEKVPNTSLLKTEIETQSNDQELDAEPVEPMIKPLKSKSKSGPYSVNHSFDERRDFILREQPKMFLVKKIYPWLFSFDEIKKELDRLYYAKSSKFLLNITKYSSRILETSKDPFKEKVLEAANAAEMPKQRKHILETGSLLLLPNAMREGFSFLRFKAKKLEKSLYPYIKAPSSCSKIIDLLTHCGIYQVVVDDCVICKPNNLSEALLALLASIFIFNIEYDPACYATYVLIEKLFLEINVTQDIPDLTKKVIKMLKPAITA